jgi:hypothetical protein
MSNEKIVVPREMLKHAINYTALHDGYGYDIVEVILRRGLEWQSEHPQVPTAEQFRNLYKGRSDYGPLDMIVDWQRRMYLAPEPEVPEEIKDLLYPRVSMDKWCDTDGANERIEKAYRRGQSSK